MVNDDEEEIEEDARGRERLVSGEDNEVLCLPSCAAPSSDSMPMMVMIWVIFWLLARLSL